MNRDFDSINSGYDSTSILNILTPLSQIIFDLLDNIHWKSKNKLKVETHETDP